ncbi:MAG TPA: hypothetical protein VF111_15115 [Thermoanaerobaculia bacterium]
MSEFTYNASALGLGGVLNIKGVRTVIPSIASVALAPTGGEAHAVESNYFNKGIGFDRAESHIYGFSNGSHGYTTYSTATISGLTIFNRLRIGLLHATVESRHDLGQDGGESKFRLKAEYRDVEVDGYEIVPEIDIDFTDTFDTYQKVDWHLRQKKDVYAPRFGLTQEQLVEALDKTPAPPLAVSLVKDLHVNQMKPSVAAQPQKHQAKAHGLTIPNFGRAHFAEYHVKRGRRRVTLLRLDLNSLQQLEQQLVQQLEGTVEPLPGQEPPPPPPPPVNETEPDGEQYDGELSMTSLDGNGSPPWDN